MMDLCVKTMNMTMNITCTPCPQVTEQEDQAVQDDQAQATAEFEFVQKLYLDL